MFDSVASPEDMKVPVVVIFTNNREEREKTLDALGAFLPGLLGFENPASAGAVSDRRIGFLLFQIHVVDIVGEVCQLTTSTAATIADCDLSRGILMSPRRVALTANFQEGHRRFGVLLRRLLSPFLQAKLSRLAACRGNVFFWGDLTRDRRTSIDIAIIRESIKRVKAFIRPSVDPATVESSTRGTAAVRRLLTMKLGYSAADFLSLQHSKGSSQDHCLLLVGEPRTMEDHPASRLLREVHVHLALTFVKQFGRPSDPSFERLSFSGPQGKRFSQYLEHLIRSIFWRKALIQKLEQCFLYPCVGRSLLVTLPASEPPLKVESDELAMAFMPTIRRTFVAAPVVIGPRAMGLFETQKEDPPLTLSQIPEERRCLLCHTIAKGWARALESKVASLPTRQLHEEEFIDVLETICINNSVKEPCGLGTSMAVSTYSGVCRGGRLVAYLRQAQGHSCRAPMHS
ncbi:unnamed protein product [Durusdinium trenchii]|uniref:Uncharacterized protein n=1 Tax=Durusdinium trenchii TaxID=1381693 RepID=A0ABP0MCM5_9DINO